MQLSKVLTTAMGSLPLAEMIPAKGRNT